MSETQSRVGLEMSWSDYRVWAFVASGLTRLTGTISAVSVVERCWTESVGSAGLSLRGVIASCLGTGMQRDDKSAHSHDITTTRTTAHEKRSGIHSASRKPCLPSDCHSVQTAQ